MNLKNLLLSGAILAAMPLSASVYYVTPEGAGTKDGSSWENAFDTEALCAQALKNVNGDVYNFAGGKYYPAGTIIFKKTTWAVLNGSTDPANRTILSGDKDGSNHPSDGDSQRLLRFQSNTANTATTHPIQINNIDFTCVYTNMDADLTADTGDTGTAGIGALYIDNSGGVTVNSCNFYQNWSQGNLGGSAAHIRRSQVKFINCNFHNNSANYRGGAVRISSDNVAKGNVTFEGCTFRNNVNYHQLGGAIFMSHGVSLNIIDCTISDNKAASQGAAIYANASAQYPCALRIVNSTIAGNHITGATPDGQVTLTQFGTISSANSIILSNTTNESDVFIYGATASDKFSAVSGGYNCIGSVTDALGAKGFTWTDTDNVSADNNYSVYFGENVINNKNVISLKKYTKGASADEIVAATASWNLPAGLDLSKDMLGNTRLEGATPGSYAMYEKDFNDVSSGVELTSTGSQKIVRIAPCVYVTSDDAEIVAIAIDGSTTLRGTGSIDLGSLPSGIYLLRSEGQTLKVAK